MFFDNLSVQHKQRPMLEENHYYPFGLAMAGISDKALKPKYTENKYRYNGGTELQNKEFSDGSGLELYDANARMYDPQIGRFGGIDELSSETTGVSPYSFGFDDPGVFDDPTGLKPEPMKDFTRYSPWEQEIINQEGGGEEGEHYSYMDGNGNLWMHQDPLLGTASQGIQYEEGNGLDGFGNLEPGNGMVITSVKSGYSNGVQGYWVNSVLSGAAGDGHHLLAEVNFGREFITAGNESSVDQLNDWVGIGSGAVENLGSGFRITEAARAVGWLSLGVGTALDIHGMYIYKNNPNDPEAVSPGHAGLNFGFGLVGMYGGPIGWTISGIYFGVQSTIGWDPAMQGVEMMDKSKLQMINAGIMNYSDFNN